MRVMTKKQTQRRALHGFLLATVCGMVLGGCGQKGVGGEIAALKKAGRAVSEFTDTDASVFAAKKCQAGTVDQIPAVLCEYESPETAARGQEAAENWALQGGTGVALRRELVVLALSDKAQADPSGKTISAVAKVFRRVARK